MLYSDLSVAALRHRTISALPLPPALGRLRSCRHSLRTAYSIHGLSIALSGDASAEPASVMKSLKRTHADLLCRNLRRPLVLCRKEGLIVMPIVLLYLLCLRHMDFGRKFNLPDSLSSEQSSLIAYLLLEDDSTGRVFISKPYIN
jgi:hypothetical protein